MTSVDSYRMRGCMTLLEHCRFLLDHTEMLHGPFLDCGYWGDNITVNQLGSVRKAHCYKQTDFVWQ